MAATITTDLVTLYDGNSAIGGADTFSGFQRFGSACNGDQVSNGTGHFISAVTPFSLVGRSIYSWMVGPGAIGPKSQGGYRIVIGDGTNERAYFVGGSDSAFWTVRGWFCFSINGDSLPTQFAQLSGSAQPNLSNITRVGVGFTTVAKSVGNSPNVFWDVARVGTGLTVAGDPNNPGTWSDIANQDESTANAWGLVRRIGEGVYGSQGSITIGSTNSATTFDESDSLVFFEQINPVSNDFYKFNIIGSPSHTNIAKFGIKTGTGNNAVGSNGVTIQSGAGLEFNADDNSAVQFYGSTLRGATGGVGFGTGANSEIISSTIDQSGPAVLNTTIARNMTISGASNAGLIWQTDITDVQNSNFNSNNIGIRHSDGGSVTYQNLQFAGNTTDVEYTGTGTLTVNAAGTTNASSSSATGGGTVIIENTVSLTFTGLQPNTEVRIYDANRTELAGQEDVNTGSFTYSYNFSAGATVTYVIFNKQFLPIKITNFELPANDTALPIQQVFDRVYSNP